jgi:8-oxo-dGTP diphosphatase
MPKTPDFPAVPTDGRYPECPVVAVGAVVFNEERVLLVRRGQPPSHDLWAIPGGKVRLGETLQAAAEREILEESGLTVRARQPVYTFDLIEQDAQGRIRFHYVIVDLITDYVAGTISAGDDAREVRWIGPDEIRRLEVSPQTVDLLQRKFGFGRPRADGSPVPNMLR